MSIDPLHSAYKLGSKLAYATKLSEPTYNNMSDEMARHLYNKHRQLGMPISNAFQDRLERMGSFARASDAQVRFLKDQSKDYPNVRPPSLQQRIDNLPAKPPVEQPTKAFMAQKYDSYDDDAIRRMRDMFGGRQGAVPHDLQRRFMRLPVATKPMGSGGAAGAAIGEVSGPKKSPNSSKPIDPPKVSGGVPGTNNLLKNK